MPASAVSGVYFAKITRTDTGAASHIVFVVRNDASHSDVVFQTSDTTWQAYNKYGGNSFYDGEPVGRAYKLSYNRPFSTRSDVPDGRDWVFANEYPAIRWMERNGYDVSYQSGIDTDRFGSLLTNHKAFLSVGHDEYWSGTQRTNVEAARDAGVNLAFFSGNEVYWKTRYEPSIDGANTNYRTLVTYKETWANAKIDPNPEWTGTWRDPRFSPPANGGRPENALDRHDVHGQLLQHGHQGARRRRQDALLAQHHVATQSAGATATLADGTLGYEYDAAPDNGFQPAGLIRLSTTDTISSREAARLGQHDRHRPGHPQPHAVPGAQRRPGLRRRHRSSGPGVSTRTTTDRRGAGTRRGLTDAAGDAQPARRHGRAAHDPADRTWLPPPRPPTRRPRPRRSPLRRPTPTSSVAPPRRSPAPRPTSVAARSAASRSPPTTARTWHPATGRASWTYSWGVQGFGPTVIKVRATDDSGNIQTRGDHPYGQRLVPVHGVRADRAVHHLDQRHLGGDARA